MARKSTAILVFLVLMNGVVTIMGASGLNEDWGVEPSLGATEDINDAVDSAKKGFSPKSGPIETLFSLFIAATQLFSGLIQAIFSAPEMFHNLGLPDWFVLSAFGPMYVVGTLDLVFAATGRDL